jgi:hypothetical protein
MSATARHFHVAYDNSFQGDYRKVSAAVERICALGCRSVNALILRLETGLPVSETAHLNGCERREVLAELKSIMSVYGDRCAADIPFVPND